MLTSIPHLLAPLRHLDDLAHAIAADGPAPHEAALQRVVSAARARGGHGPALDALADATRPDIVRQRAFAHVHAGLRINAADAPAPQPIDRNRRVA